MKMLLLLASGFLPLFDSYGQGTVYFTAKVAGVYDAPVFDVDGRTPLWGPDFLVQMYAGLTPGSLVPVAMPLTFRTGPAAGYWIVEGVSIPAVLPGELVYVQIRAWEAAAGSLFEEAQNSGGKRGMSKVLGVITGGSGEPPSLPSNLAGLESFGMIVDSHTMMVPPGFSLISNPLFRGSNTVVEILPNVPEGTILYRFDNRTKTFSVNGYDFAKWSNESESLNPGEGAFVFNPSDSPLELKFTGEVRPFEKIAARATGFYLVSCGAVQACRIEEFLNFPPIEGDVYYRFENGKYVVSNFIFGNWTSPPVIRVGESVFIKLAPPPAP